MNVVERRQVGGGGQRSSACGGADAGHGSGRAIRCYVETGRFQYAADFYANEKNDLNSVNVEDLEKLKDTPIIIKEGTEYRMKVAFR